MDAALREAERTWRASVDVDDARTLLVRAARVGATDLAAEVLEELARKWEVRQVAPAAELILSTVERTPPSERLRSAPLVDRLACSGHAVAVERYREWFPALARVVGRTPAMREARKLAARWAPEPHPILITGESGVGHLFLARAIHELSGRPALGRTHAGATAAGLVELELQQETPEDGTLYLAYADPDELPVRALEVCRARRARLIVGACNDADEFAPALATHVIELPPLRDRFDDLPLLVVELLRRRGRSETPPETFLAHLRGLGWGGNVRHLDNYLDRLCTLAEDGDLFAPELW